MKSISFSRSTRDQNSLASACQREKKKIGCSQGSNFSILEHEIATACATVHSATHFLSVKQFYVSVAINYLADALAVQTLMFNFTKEL
jgi:hypothetical protein